MGRFLEVFGRRRKKHGIAVSADVGDGGIRQTRRQVLDHLETRDEVVLARNLVGDGTHRDVGGECGGSLADGEGRDIETRGVHAVCSESFDQEADGTASVERGAGPDGGRDPLGHRGEEPVPLFYPTAVRQITRIVVVVVVVSLVVEALEGGDQPVVSRAVFLFTQALEEGPEDDGRGRQVDRRHPRRWAAGGREPLRCRCRQIEELRELAGKDLRLLERGRRHDHRRLVVR